MATSARHSFSDWEKMVRWLLRGHETFPSVVPYVCRAAKRSSHLREKTCKKNKRRVQVDVVHRRHHVTSTSSFDADCVSCVASCCAHGDGGGVAGGLAALASGTGGVRRVFNSVKKKEKETEPKLHLRHHVPYFYRGMWSTRFSPSGLCRALPPGSCALAPLSFTSRDPTRVPGGPCRRCSSSDWCSMHR